MAQRRSSATDGGNTAPRTCVDRIVPEEYQPARSQVEEVVSRLFQAPARAPRATNLTATDIIPAPHAAIVVAKTWAAGRELKCKFLDGSAEQRRKVQDKAHIWEQYANIKIRFVTTGDAEVRISFSADAGSWSAVGTDGLVTAYFPRYQPTMNFGWLRDDTPDQEYERVTVHEFGHALGLIHEHQNPSVTLDWNKPAVYRYFAGPPNFWSKKEVDQNILMRYSREGIKYTRFDPKSIMLYQFDAFLFRNRQGTPLNTQLSDMDKAFIRQIYPK